MKLRAAASNKKILKNKKQILLKFNDQEGIFNHAAKIQPTTYIKS